MPILTGALVVAIGAALLFLAMRGKAQHSPSPKRIAGESQPQDAGTDALSSPWLAGSFLTSDDPAGSETGRDIPMPRHTASSAPQDAPEGSCAAEATFDYEHVERDDREVCAVDSDPGGSDSAGADDSGSSDSSASD